jgi:hypothetical protein
MGEGQGEGAKLGIFPLSLTFSLQESEEKEVWGEPYH